MDIHGLSAQERMNLINGDGLHEYSFQEALNKYVIGTPSHRYSVQEAVNMIVNGVPQRTESAQVCLNKYLGETDHRKWSVQEALNIIETFLPQDNLVSNISMKNGELTDKVGNTGIVVYYPELDSNFQYNDTSISWTDDPNQYGFDMSTHAYSASKSGDTVTIDFNGSDTFSGKGAIPHYCMLDFSGCDNAMLKEIMNRDNNAINNGDIVSFENESGYEFGWRVETLLRLPEFIRSLQDTWHIFLKRRATDEALEQLVIYNPSNVGNFSFNDYAFDDDIVGKEVMFVEVTQGIMDFSVAGVTGLKWYFPDGTTSTSVHPAKEMEGVAICVANSFEDATVDREATGDRLISDLAHFSNVNYRLNFYKCFNLIGDLSSVSNINYSLSLYRCSKITGDLSSVSNINYSLNLSSCSKITGDLSSVSNISDSLSLAGCSHITGNLSFVSNVSSIINFKNCYNIEGDLSSISNVDSYINVDSCYAITGSIQSSCTATYINLSDTSCSPEEVDTTLANLAIAGQSNGTLHLNGLHRTSASNADKAILEGRGWAISGGDVI